MRSLRRYFRSLISVGMVIVMVMGAFNEVRSWRIVWVQCTMRKSAKKNEAPLGISRPILLREVVTDYGSSPFRVYHSWFSLQGFDQMVLETWNNIDLDDNNKMVQFKKKLQILKKEIRSWVNDCKKNQSGRLEDLRSKLCHIDKVIDQGGVNDDILLTLLGAPVPTDVNLNYTFPNRLSLISWTCLERHSPISEMKYRNESGVMEKRIKSPGPDGAIEAGIFKGIKIGSSLNISHLFYADDAVFIGEWSIANLSGITHILHCFSMLSGLSINLKEKSPTWSRDIEVRMLMKISRHLLSVADVSYGVRQASYNAGGIYHGRHLVS
ncbi:hypothetical protein Tco_0183628 [Tanacetum coccineum]